MNELPQATPPASAGSFGGVGVSKPSVRDRTRARLLLFGSATFFGAMATLARVATAGGFSASQLSVVRFTVGAAVLLAAFQLRPGTFRPRHKPLLAARALFGGASAALYYVAISMTSAGEATLLNNTYPILATILSLLILKERPTLALAGGLAVTPVGVFFVLGGGKVSFSLGEGEIIGIASACFASGAVLAIRALRRTDNAPTIFFSFCLGGLVCSVPFAFTPWTANVVAWAAALGTGLMSVGGQLLMTEAYGALTVPEAAIWQQLTPVSSYVWALALLGESIAGPTAVGVLLVVVGVAWGGALGTASRKPPPVRQGLEEQGQ